MGCILLAGREGKELQTLVNVQVSMAVVPVCAKSFCLFEWVRGAVGGGVNSSCCSGMFMGIFLVVPEVGMAPWRSFPAAGQDEQLEGDISRLFLMSH